MYIEDYLSDNSRAIFLLCHKMTNEKIKIITPAKYENIVESLLAHNLTPSDLLYKDIIFLKSLNIKNFDNASYINLEQLLNKDREKCLYIDFNKKYLPNNIKVVTRADKDYPKKIKNKLLKKSPPMFYYAGDLNILKETQAIGFVGSRSICDDDASNVKFLVTDLVNKGYSIVSGGALGVDKTSEESCLNNGGTFIGYLSDNLLKRIKTNISINNTYYNLSSLIENGQCIFLSRSHPEDNFSVGRAMERNKYIYIQSIATVVIKSDLNKGGTWAGAIEALKTIILKFFVLIIKIILVIKN